MINLFKKSLRFHLQQVTRLNTSIIGIQNKDTEIILKKINKYKDFHDKYGIYSMTSKDKLLDLFNSRKQKLSLNEQIKILQKISELNLGQTYKTIYGIDHVIQKIQQRKDKLDFEEDIYLGDLIDGLQKLEYYQNTDIWVQICDSILHDRFEVHGEQVYKILKGISYMKHQVKEEYQIDLFKQSLRKLRDIMSIVILDQKYQYKLDQLTEIANLFYKEQLLNEQFMKLIDFSIFKILQTNKNIAINDKDIKDIINISFIFSIHNYYSETINKFLEQQDTQKLLDQNIIKMMTIAIFLKQHNHSQLNLDTLIENKLSSLDFKIFSLFELNMLLQNLNQLNIQNSDSIIQIIDNIILNSDDDNQFTLEELKNTHMIRQYTNDQLGEFAFTASKAKLDPEHIIEFLEYINVQNIEHLFKDLYNTLPEFLANNINYYNWEQQCLLYYFMRKEQHFYEDFHHQNGHLNVLKEFIKLNYAQKSAQARFMNPIPITSNFYKILTVIDLAELFSDSHYS